MKTGEPPSLCGEQTDSADAERARPAANAESVINEERLAAIGRNVAGAAHAIKSIISRMEGSLNNIERKSLTASNGDASLPRMWRVFRESVGELSVLSRRILAMPVECRPVLAPASLNDLLEDLARRFESTATARNIRIELSLGADIPFFLFDRSLLAQAVADIIDNAVDASAKSKTEASVLLATRYDRAKGCAELRIVDNGPGIPAENRERVFDAFFTTKGSKGTGLGLYLARRAVEAHDGTIDAESRPGRTVLRLRLPLRREDEPPRKNGERFHPRA